MTSDKREKAIKYLTEEIRSLRMAPKINGCPMTPEWADQLEIMEACLEAVRSAHFADADKMQPLTVEQLREMDGKAAYLPEPNCWGLVTKNPFVPLFTFPDGEQCNAVEWYETVGPAYAYHPAHIDREAWTECDRCKGKENALDQFRSHDFQIDGSEIYFHDTENGWEGEEIHFCPWCGRPLTEEAWDELEKRLRG